MLLTELANRDVKFKIIRADEKVFDTEAVIGKRKIIFSAVDVDGCWNIVFAESWFDEGEWHETYETTGSGKEFEVLSLITTCMKEFLKRNKPNEIRFSADKYGGRARANIYRRLADRLLPGFTREEDDDGPAIEFRYVKEEHEID